MDVGSEAGRPNCPVPDDRDTVIEVDWTFQDGTTKNNKWLYFQEGAYMSGVEKTGGKIVAKYSKSGDIAASVHSFGKGTVGLIGPHTEADQGWCKLTFIL